MIESRYVWIRQTAAKRGSTPKVGQKEHRTPQCTQTQSRRKHSRTPLKSPNTDIKNSVSSKEDGKRRLAKASRQNQKSSNPRQGKRIKETEREKTIKMKHAESGDNYRTNQEKTLKGR
jgi:hypothetical protein